MSNTKTTKVEVSNKQYCDLAEFKIAFIICVGILAIYSTVIPSRQGNVMMDMNPKTVSVLTDTELEVTGFIKRDGASGFSASSKAPEWATRIN